MDGRCLDSWLRDVGVPGLIVRSGAIDVATHLQLPGQALSPNEMFAVLVARAGYRAGQLTADDYVELLAADWRTINDYGVKIDYRTYDSPELNPYRRQHSGVDAKGGKWAAVPARR